MKEREEQSPQTALIKAFDESATKSVVDICRIAGFSRVTFYYYFNQDANFRKQVIKKQKAHLSKKIAATA